MKSINLFFTVLLVSVLFVFTSCGDDDKDRETATKDIVLTYSIPIEGIKDQAQSPPKTTLKLSGTLEETVLKNLVSGDLQRGKSSLMIKGLKAIGDENVQLTNIKIKIGSGTEFSLGTCTAKVSSFESDVAYDDDKYTDIIKSLFDALMKNKQADVSISFTPSQTITKDTHPVTLELTVSGRYLYYQ